MQLFVEGTQTRDPQQKQIASTPNDLRSLVLGRKSSTRPLQHFPIESRLMHHTFVDRTIQKDHFAGRQQQADVCHAIAINLIFAD